MTWDLQWHHEVDVVCTDAGIAGLAGAIAAVDQGAEVLVASAQAPAESRAGSRHPSWFMPGSSDQPTIQYLGELAGDLDAAALPQLDDDLPIRPAPQAGSDTAQEVPPFHGSQLRDWAARCIPSPSGYLYTRVTDWTSAAMESVDGEALEVTEIGSLKAESGDVIDTSQGWLESEAQTHGVDIQPVQGLERLVFDDGEVIGAVFASQDGPLAVRARHGVLLCGSGQRTGRSLRMPVTGNAALRVVLVGKAASRFGRVELHTPDPVDGLFP